MSILDRFHRRRVAANPLEAAAAPEVDTAPPASAPAEPASPPASDTVVRRRALGRLQVGIAALLCLVNGAVSGLLLLQHHGEERAAAAVSQVCGEGADRSGCEIVARSRYSTVAGVPLAAIGLFFYLALAALLALSLLGGAESRDAAAWLALVALMLAMGTDLALLAVQMVAIRAFCRLCLATYVVNLLALVVLIPARRDTRVIKEAVRRPDGRVALAGSLLIALALGAAVTAAEVGLSYRERERASAVLGSLPPPLPSPSLPSTLSSPAIPGSDVQRYQEEARVATEQARRLQEILDDPHK